jgi:hypothetical protein
MASSPGALSSSAVTVSGTRILSSKTVGGRDSGCARPLSDEQRRTPTLPNCLEQTVERPRFDLAGRAGDGFVEKANRSWIYYEFPRAFVVIRNEARLLAELHRVVEQKQKQAA